MATWTIGRERREDTDVDRGTLLFTRFSKTWGPAPKLARADLIDVHATNIAAASIDVTRAHVDCHVTLHVQSDGPLTITLPGCRRTIRAS